MHQTNVKAYMVKYDEFNFPGVKYFSLDIVKDKLCSYVCELGDYQQVNNMNIYLINRPGVAGAALQTPL